MVGPSEEVAKVCLPIGTTPYPDFTSIQDTLSLLAGVIMV